MGCTGECPSNCSCNGNYCGGNQPACSNSYSFTTITAGVTTITAAHLSELETAINQERTHPTRRCVGTSPACGSNCPGTYSFTGARTPGDEILATFYNAVSDANNTCGEYHSTATYPIASPGSVIQASEVQHLQTKINETRNMCICNTYLVCGTDCGCNGQCPADGDPY
jgi:hypothetical protein